MKFNTETEEVIIDQTDLGVENEEFSFTVKVLTYKELLQLKIKNKIPEEATELDNLKLSEVMFIEIVTAWTNVQGSDDKDLECNKANKTKLFNKNPFFFSAVLKAASEKVLDDKKKLKKV